MKGRAREIEDTSQKIFTENLKTKVIVSANINNDAYSIHTVLFRVLKETSTYT